MNDGQHNVYRKSAKKCVKERPFKEVETPIYPLALFFNRKLS